jgi:biotin transporter BioY
MALFKKRVKGKKKMGLFSKIESREDALKLIKDGSIVFCVIAGISIIWTYFSPSQYIEETYVRYAIGVFYVVLAGALFKWKSRVAAVLLLILTSDALITTFSNRFGNGDGG